MLNTAVLLTSGECDRGYAGGLARCHLSSPVSGLVRVGLGAFVCVIQTSGDTSILSVAVRVELGIGERCLDRLHGVLLLAVVSDFTVAWSLATSLTSRSKSAEVR